jgi:hypothetical protein
MNRETLLADKDRYEPIARQIFEAAIAECRCGELLLSLFDGAAATADPPGRLKIVWLTGKDHPGA